MAEIASERAVVLVVEDDPNIRSLLTDVLTDEGYDVVAAANGSEALSVMSTVWPNLITLDLNLPETIGEWVLQKIHEPHERRQPPVVIITAKLSIAPEIRKLVPSPGGEQTNEAALQ